MAAGLAHSSPVAKAEAEADAQRPVYAPDAPVAPVVAVNGPVSAPLVIGPSAYTYQWEVSDPEGNNFYGHGEKRDGALTSGSYFILLPDGRRQRVDYTVEGDSGYIATVTYE